MIRDVYARLQLEVLKVEVLPEGRELPKLLMDWGLAKSPQETMWVIAYDVRRTIRTVIEVARGGHAEMLVHIPTLLSAVLTAGAEAFTVAHNHPTGDPFPSVQDHDLTRKLMAAANACGLYFDDHLIIEPQGDYFSFYAAGLITRVSKPGGRRLDIAAAAKKGKK